jgi:hypothetical protein
MPSSYHLSVWKQERFLIPGTIHLFIFGGVRKDGMCCLVLGIWCQSGFRAMKKLVTILVLLLTGCSVVPKKVSMDDPQVQPLLKAAASFDRTSYGFTPIPKAAADVRLESKPTGRYDAMLHIYSKTSRTIAFRKTGGTYKWIGDQEIFQGPKMYKTVDGTFHEQLTFTYEIESVSGFPTNRLNITYSGEDVRLANKASLALADVRPILKEWGY